MQKKLISVAAIVALAIGVAGCATGSDTPTATGTAASLADCTMTMIPKNTDNPFFAAGAFGANEAATDMGGQEINYTGTAQPDVPGQIQRIQSAAQQGSCGIAISGLDPQALAPALREARSSGTTVISYDADVAVDARTVWVAPATDESLGVAQFQLLAEAMNFEGTYAIISAQSTAAGQNAWIAAAAEEAKKPEYAAMELVRTVYGDDVPQTSYDAAVALYQAYPELDGIFAPTPVSLQAAVKAKDDLGFNPDLVITGLGWPPSDGELLKNGDVHAFVLWSPRDMGYLTYYAMNALLTGEITGAEGDVFDAGRLGKRTVGANGAIYTGEPMVFTADNVDDLLENFRTE
jgi:rhamnose transport system substrate-binding protein